MLPPISRCLPQGILARSSARSTLPIIRTSPRLAHTSANVQLAYEEVQPPTKDSPSDVSTSGPLVICHGLFGSKQNWRSLSKTLSKSLDRPVYALDLRNHGTSPHHAKMDYSCMADDVLEFCGQKSLSNISLLGHSMGGKVVMAAALSPSLPSNLLSNLIVADISPAKGPISDEFKTYLKAMQEVESKQAKTRKEADDILAAYEKDIMIRQFLLTNLEGGPKPHQKFRIPLDMLDQAVEGIGDFPYEPSHRTWEGRTLFIKGAKSKYLNKRNIPVAKEFFPNMQLVTLETGHWVHAERPMEFVKAVTDFIKGP